MLRGRAGVAMLPLEMWLRSAGRMLVWAVIGLVLLVAAVDAALHHKPGPAPCVTSSGAPCTFTPHAPRSVAP
jgi:hypothetical protein